jgi:hypothetical protein
MQSQVLVAGFFAPLRGRARWLPGTALALVENVTNLLFYDASMTLNIILVSRLEQGWDDDTTAISDGDQNTLS